MRIKMLTTKRVSEDGFKVRQLVEGGVYEVAHMAACGLIRYGNAEGTDEPLNEIEPVSTLPGALAADFNRVFATK